MADKPIEWEKAGELFPRKILQNRLYVENLGNWNLESDGRKVPILWGKNGYQFPCMGAIFPLGSQPMLYIITCEIHGFAKSIENPSNWESHFSPKVWLLFFHQIPILRYTLPHEKCMAFASISNSMEKCNKIHRGSYKVVFQQHYFSTCSKT